ncbi:hypothetical protein EDEG_02818 [Edhazardia aedis USNM 41457]|uniref:Protein HIR n=1 Tax=Edhazardia aedis (strain USNM 41457) TaxID=1003232 RepID=J8ZSY5_EDHAE|nr:hypothetical protein EDEG_02818 [Edhazardia aedis USNM 41457]|eukprot:EJW02778.1 hypothetical protein EDEG_02818 [Edhazardia aedis USNM 41457]
MKIREVDHIHGMKRRPCPIFTIDYKKGYFVSGSVNGELKLNYSKEYRKFNDHAGTILCARFNPTGEFIATCSDDKSVRVYKVDDAEHTLTFVKSLEYFESDVVDALWFRNLLLCCDLTGFLAVFEIQNFTLVKKTKPMDLCRGLSTDPQNEIVVLQGEKNMKIFDMNIEEIKNVSEPFKGKITEAFFARNSWSPDGKYLAVCLAFNGKQNSIEILRKDTFNSEFSLVGHVAPAEVARFLPKTFSINGDLHFVVAVGSQDKSISLWSTKSQRPFVLLKDFTEGPIMDMFWDNESLVVCSYDGKVHQIDFDLNELGEIVVSPGFYVQEVPSIPFCLENLIIQEKGIESLAFDTDQPPKKQNTDEVEEIKNENSDKEHNIELAKTKEKKASKQIKNELPEPIATKNEETVLQEENFTPKRQKTNTKKASKKTVQKDDVKYASENKIAKSQEDESKTIIVNAQKNSIKKNTNTIENPQAIKVNTSEPITKTDDKKDSKQSKTLAEEEKNGKLVGNDHKSPKQETEENIKNEQKIPTRNDSAKNINVVPLQKKKIKPVIIAPLKPEKNVIKDPTRKIFAIFRNTPKKIEFLEKKEIPDKCDFTIGDYKVVIENSQKCKVSVHRLKNIFYNLYFNRVFLFAGNEFYICFVFEDNGSDAIAIYDLETGNLTLPIITIHTVVCIDLLNNELLILEGNGEFQVINLKKQKKVVNGSLPVSARLLNIKLDKKYFILTQYDTEVYFYNRKLKLWMKKTHNFNSIIIKKNIDNLENLDIFDSEDAEDQTINEIEYEFKVNEINCDRNGMLNVGKKATKYALKINRLSENTYNKYVYIFTKLCYIDFKKEAYKMLEEMNSNCIFQPCVIEIMELLSEMP